MRFEVVVEKDGRAWVGHLDGQRIVGACGPLSYVLSQIKAALMAKIEAGK